MLAEAVAEMRRQGRPECEMADLFTDFKGIQVTLAVMSRAMIAGRIDCKTAGRLLVHLQTMSKLLWMLHRRKEKPTRRHGDTEKSRETQQICAEERRLNREQELAKVLPLHRKRSCDICHQAWHLWRRAASCSRERNIRGFAENRRSVEHGTVGRGKSGVRNQQTSILHGAVNLVRSFQAVKIIYYPLMGKNLKPLWPYLSKYRVTLFWGAITVLFNNGLWVLWPQVVRRAVDDLNHHGITHQKILIFAALLVGLALGKGVFQFLTRWLVIGVSREIEYDLRNDMFRHLESLSYSYYQKNRTGDIMARATNDLNAVRMLLGPAIMYTANTLVFTAVALVFMWHISHRLTLYAFAPLPVASIVVQYIGRRIHERFEKIQAQFSDISARAQENFSGARVVRAYAQEEAEIALFETSNEEYVTRSLPLARLPACCGRPWNCCLALPWCLCCGWADVKCF